MRRTFGLLGLVLFLCAGYAFAQVETTPLGIIYHQITVLPFVDKSPTAGEDIPPPPPGVELPEVSPFATYEWLSYAIPACVAYKMEVSQTMLATSLDVLQDACKACGVPLEEDLSDSQIVKLGMYLGASYVLFGDFNGSQGTVTINYHLMDVENGMVIANASVGGDENNFLSYTTEITRGVTNAVGLSPTPELELYPTEDLVALKWYAKGLSASFTGQKIGFFSQATAKDPDFSPAYAKLAEALFNEKDYEGAVSQYKNALQKESLPSSYLGLGLVYLKMGQKKLKDLIIIDAQLLPVVDNLGKVLSTMTISVDDVSFNNLADKVVSGLSQLALTAGETLSPDLAEAVASLNSVAQNIKIEYGDEFVAIADAIKKADEAINEAKKRSMENAVPPEEFALASQAFNDALSVDPNYIPAMVRLGVVIEEKGDHAKAIDYYLSILDKNYRLPEVYSRLGNDYWIVGATSTDWKSYFQSAVDAYAKALAFRPDWSLVHYNIASLYLKLSKFTEAVYHYERFLELEPNTDKYEDIMKTIENIRAGKY